VTDSAEDTRGKPPQSGFRRFVIAGIAILLSGATITMAWPRLISGVSEGPLEQTLRTLTGPKSASDPVGRHVLAIKEQIARVHSNSKTWADIGYLQMKASLELGPLTEDGKADLDASIIAQHKSLSLEPGNAFVWTRLAQDLIVRDGPTSENLSQILETAVDFSPYDSRLVMARVDIALLAWDQLSDETRSAMNTQIHLAAAQSPTALAKIARERFALTRMIDLLSDSPALLKRFIYAYSR
jgi:hypothetical protein